MLFAFFLEPPGETFDWLPVTSSVRADRRPLKRQPLPLPSQPATERGKQLVQTPPTAGPALDVRGGSDVILMKSRIGSYSRHSHCATSVGWQTSFNIISGQQGKSTKKCCPATTLGRTEWRPRCRGAEIINPSTVNRDTHR